MPLPDDATSHCLACGTVFIDTKPREQPRSYGCCVYSHNSVDSAYLLTYAVCSSALRIILKRQIRVTSNFVWIIKYI